MSQEIILSKEVRAELKELSSEQFKTRTLSSEITNEGIAYALACIGAELGLSPLQSLRGIYMVKGKPILAAQTIQAIVVRRRDICEYFMLVESTREKATYETRRVGDPRPTTLTYTIEDAKAAGLLKNDVWKHTAAMLRNRCVSALAKASYPDLALGLYEESEGEEIRGDYRVMVQEPVVSLPARQAAQLPAAAPDPLAAFAPLPNEPSELDQTFIGQMAATLAEINACATLAELQACAAKLKENPLAAEGTESRKTLLEAHKKHRADIEVSDLLVEAKLPGADAAALWAKAHAIKGVTEQHEKQLADGLSVQP
jgi:hypothetical protein